MWLGGVVVRVGLATGDCGFNSSRCTVECNLGQAVHTHCPAPLKLRPYGAI